MCNLYVCVCVYIYIYIYIYRVSQEECARLWEGVPYIKVYRYNPKLLCPNLNGYGDNGQRKVSSSCGSTHCTCQLTISQSSTARSYFCNGRTDPQPSKQHCFRYSIPLDARRKLHCNWWSVKRLRSKSLASRGRKCTLVLDE